MSTDKKTDFDNGYWRKTKKFKRVITEVRTTRHFRKLLGIFSCDSGSEVILAIPH